MFFIKEGDYIYRWVVISTAVEKSFNIIQRYFSPESSRLRFTRKLSGRNDDLFPKFILAGK
jgi:hypothetical protein